MKLPKRKILSLLRSNKLCLFFFLVILLVLPLSFSLVKKVQYYLTEALGQPANIIVDASINQGPIFPIWQALAQGGEEKNPFDNIINEISALQPKYIRIDHIYDFYDVVRKENERLIFNWEQLVFLEKSKAESLKERDLLN